MTQSPPQALSNDALVLIQQTVRDPDTLRQLISAAYERLRLVARNERAKIPVGQTLSTTALVNEAYLKLDRFDQRQTIDQRRFFGLCATVMRRIIIDHLKKKREALSDEQGLSNAAIRDDEQRQVLKVDELLELIERKNPRMAQIVEYRFFGGYTNHEIADILQINEKTVRREWLKAKALLALEIAQP